VKYPGIGLNLKSSCAKRNEVVPKRKGKSEPKKGIEPGGSPRHKELRRKLYNRQYAKWRRNLKK